MPLVLAGVNICYNFQFLLHLRDILTVEEVYYRQMVSIENRLRVQRRLSKVKGIILSSKLISVAHKLFPQIVNPHHSFVIGICQSLVIHIVTHKLPEQFRR